MAVGNTFGATALSSYGGFWIAFAIIFTPGGFEIESTIVTAQGAAILYDSIGLFLAVRLNPQLRHLSPQLTFFGRPGSSSPLFC